MAALAARDLTGRGTSENTWGTASFLPRELATVTAPRVILVAPHPDDEVLGAGGTVAALGARGLEVLLVAVTDGEASHPGREEELRQRRPAETAAALAHLDLHDARSLRLRHPDGAIEPERLREELSGIVRADDLVLAPWIDEGHPDHDLVGQVCHDVCLLLGAELWSYLVWTWHWARPTSPDVPWHRARRVDLTPEVTDRKARAIACFTSQTSGPDPILPAHVLERFHRPYEVFLAP